MTLDARSVHSFYQSPSGLAAASLLRARLSLLWPELRRARVLGIGHARPYLGLWREEADCCLDMALTAADGAWTPDGRSLSAVMEGEALPFADVSFDRILLVHGLEVAANARRTIRECWRVLRDDGRLLVVTPNRVGLWAHLESTPFGQGEPYTQGQVARLLASGLFAVERRDSALFLPPVSLRPLLRLAARADGLGRRVMPRFGGVLLAEAVKDVYAAAPRLPVARRRVMPVSATSLAAASLVGRAPRSRPAPPA